MTKTLSYDNDPKKKQAAVLRAKKHVAQDMLVKGSYGRMNGSFTGCSIGCDAFDITGEVDPSDKHSITANYFGFPEWLEHVRDHFFERLEDNTTWHVDLKEAVPVGLDEIGFNKVKAKFLIFILKENIDRVEKLDIEGGLKTQVLRAIIQCLSAQEQAAEIGRINESAAWSAWSAAWSAAGSAGSAAWSAAESAAWSAAGSAWSAARSAAESAVRSAAGSAVRSAAGSAAWSAARSAAYKSYATHLLKLLREAK